MFGFNFNQSWLVKFSHSYSNVSYTCQKHMQRTHAHAQALATAYVQHTNIKHTQQECTRMPAVCTDSLSITHVHTRPSIQYNSAMLVVHIFY